jgi:PD-(D/E)XK nuclease superfamily
MTAFEPVFLPEGRELNRRVSQGFLRHFNVCPRSAYLGQTYKRIDVRTVPMERGRAFHTLAERTIKLMVDRNEPTVPPDVVKPILDEVLADPEHAVPIDEHDQLREAVWRWSTEIAIDPPAVVACETLFTMDVLGWQVRCRVDFAELLEDRTRLVIKDWKTGRGAPGQEEIARKRPDGTLAARQFQLLLYALVLVYGVPVREETCRACEGTGEVGDASHDPQRDTRDLCPFCEGDGRIETPEPLPLASRAQLVEMEFVYPGIENREGKMLRRAVTLTRLELEEYRGSLEALVRRVGEAERSGDWPAVVSDAACGECPAPSECPIPVELRDGRGSVSSPEEAVEAMAWADRMGALVSAARRDARAFTKAQGGVVRAAGKVLELVYSESEAITDRDAMFSAVDRAVTYGEPFDRGEFVKAKGRTEFKARELTVEELAPREGPAGEKFGDVPF